MIIQEPVLLMDVDFEFEAKWCASQAMWQGRIICLAHLAEGRVFTCDYHGPDDENLVHCRDYEKENP